MTAQKVSAQLIEAYQRLNATVDIGHWWPAESEFEIFCGVVLTQNTAWGNVEKVLQRLSESQLLEPQALVSLAPHQLADLIRPAGFCNSKALYLKHVAQWYLTDHLRAKGWETALLRKTLLKIKGIGDESADDLLLYVYDRPVFIYDRYARRLFEHLGIGRFSSYRQAKKALDPAFLEASFTLEKLKRFHGLVVEWGKSQRRSTASDPIL